MVKSVQENKATLEAQLQKGVVVHDIAKKQKQLAATKFYDDVLTSLRGLQNIGKRVERAGVKMSQQELEVFKNELTSSMTKFESLVAEQPQSTKPASAVSCGTACIEKYRQWWQFFARQACMIACMFG